MLDKLQIRNFQCHKSLEISFSSNITAITGPSDVGKSSIIRSLRWLILNKPRGDSFIKDGSNNVAVKLRVDKHTIERRRGSKGNTYILDKNEFKAFGSDTPDSISSILKIGEENISGQHQPPFWFSLTPGEVAKSLNKIIDLEVIDNITSIVASKLRKSKIELEVTQDRLKQAKEKQVELEFVPRLAAEFKSVEEKQENMWSVSRQAVALMILVVNGRKLRGVVERASESILDGRAVLELGNNYRQAILRENELTDLIDRIKIAKEKTELEVPNVVELESLILKAEHKSSKSKSIADIVTDIEIRRGELKIIEDELEDAKNELEEKTEGLCPICNRPI